jgi:hypothetical protein
MAYGRALVEEGHLSPNDLNEERRAGFRRVIAERCLAGVDNNPVAVQLARLSLWLTTLAIDRPLSFLDHRLRVGDSLIGAEPAVIFRPASAGGGTRHQEPWLDLLDVEETLQRGAQPLQHLLELPADTLRDLRAKASLWQQMVSDRSALAPWRRALSLWCARWFWPSTSARPSDAEHRALLDAVLRADRTLNGAHVGSRLATVTTAAKAYRFFHWPLEFPDVFCRDLAVTGIGGFDAVIGNPPWEMLRRDINDRSDTDRRRLVRFIRDSGRYPSCDRGHVNLYQPFVDRALSLVKPRGRIGLVLPWGLAVDDGAMRLRNRLLETTALDTLVGIDNAKGLFPIHRGLRVLVVVATTGPRTERVRLRFGLRTRDELSALGEHEDPLDEHGVTSITRTQLASVGGLARRWPDVRRPEDLAFLEEVTTRFPALGARESWGARFSRELNATDVKPHLTPKGLRVLEGKHLRRYGIAGTATARVPRSTALRLLPDARFDRDRLGYRDVSGATNNRPVIVSVIPAHVVTTHTIFCLRTLVTDEQQYFLCAVLNSLVINAVARLLMGNHLTTSLVEGLPVPPWSGRTSQRVISGLAKRLARRATDQSAEAALEARTAHLYGLEESLFVQLLGDFPMAPSVRDESLACFRRLTSTEVPKRAGRSLDRGSQN